MKLTTAGIARILGWQPGTVTDYISDNPDRLVKYMSEWAGQLLVDDRAIPVLRGLRAEKHGRKEKKYGNE